MAILTLRQSLMGLVIATTAITIGYTLFATYQAHTRSLVAESLSAQQRYAQQLAASTQNYMHEVQLGLADAADHVVRGLRADPAADLETLLALVLSQNPLFNHVFIADPQDRIQVATPPWAYQLRLDRDASQRLHAEPVPRVSDLCPTADPACRELVFAQPLFDAGGNYLGYLGSAVSLHRDSLLSRLLTHPVGPDDSMVYVVDRRGVLIYHPDPRRIGQRVSARSVVENVLAGAAGSAVVRNAEGETMLAGYAPVREIGWGVVSQRPEASVLAEVRARIGVTLRQILPYLLLALLILWWLTGRIARPLNELAASAEDWRDPQSLRRVQAIRTHHREDRRLQGALLRGLRALHEQIEHATTSAMTDPLTGLLNRRGLEARWRAWHRPGMRWVLIALDVDHFKSINDRFGHDGGDQVLVFLAHQLQAQSRSGDLIGRLGGEEFVIALPQARLRDGLRYAQRLRQAIEATPPPIGTSLTASFGVACAGHPELTLSALLKCADAALYQAKREGRNRVVAARDSLPDPAGARA